MTSITFVLKSLISLDIGSNPWVWILRCTKTGDGRSTHSAWSWFSKVQCRVGRVQCRVSKVQCRVSKVQCLVPNISAMKTKSENIPNNSWTHSKKQWNLSHWPPPQINYSPMPIALFGSKTIAHTIPLLWYSNSLNVSNLDAGSVYNDPSIFISEYDRIVKTIGNCTVS